MFEAAFGTAFSFILFFAYFGVRRIAGYAWIVDIGVFVLMLWMFQGTYAGMMTGVIASALITIYLKIVRNTIGYEILRLRRRRGALLPHLQWELVKK